MSATAEDIVVYATPTCGYCAAARRLLREKGAEFTEINVSFDPERRREMMTRSGRNTVPQIFIRDAHVGGFDDLRALEAEGRLDALLTREWNNLHNTDEG